MTKYDRFWHDLQLALSRYEIPMARRSEKSADIGWGRGFRVLIFDSAKGLGPVHDVISMPDGENKHFSEVSPEQYTEAVRKFLILSAAEKRVLNLIRAGWCCTCPSRSGMVSLERPRLAKGPLFKWARRTTVDRLTYLGLLEDKDSGYISVEYVAVQPESVSSRSVLTQNVSKQ